MPSSYSFFRKAPTNSSSSSLENDAKSEQSEEDHVNRINIRRYKTRTTQNDNVMLECPSDYDNSFSQTDDSNNNNDDDEDDNEKENDLFTPSYNTRSSCLTRQVTLYEDTWPRKSSHNENKLKKPNYRNEKSLLDTEQDKGLFLDSNQHRMFPSERSKLVGNVNTKHQSRNTHTSLSSDFKASVQQQLHSLSQSNDMPTTLKSSRNKMTSMIPILRTTVRNDDKQQPSSKIPVRTHSSSQSRSRSPVTTTKKSAQSSGIPSKIPVPVTSAVTTSQGAFRFFTATDRQLSSSSSSLHIAPPMDSAQPSKQTDKKASPFTPINERNISAGSKKLASSAGNTPPVQQFPIPLTASDEDDDSETDKLQEAELKLKLKEQKRHGKQTGALLNKLHENYEELLEKYAQAENTIDQLRFQPKSTTDNTSSSNASEGAIHFVQQPKLQITALRSNGIYHAVNATPLSSSRQVPSITSATTTTTRSNIKSVSPDNSGTGESVFLDESVPQKIVVQELTTPETLKLDLLLQTKILADKMKSFVTLMDANQLSLSEQKQVYENIKGDYEKLLQAYEISKHTSEFADIDFDADLNNELETMKQLLKEIVKRITDNLLGKSNNNSDNERLAREGSQLSQSSNQSSLFNHGDLVDQYQKIMNAVNTDIVEKKSDSRPVNTKLETGSDKMKKSTSRDSLESDISRSVSTTKIKQPYVYVSGNSDDEQQQISETTPTPLLKKVEPTALTVDRIPLASTKQYQQVNEEQAHIHGIPTTTGMKNKKSPSTQSMQEYDNLENLSPARRSKKKQQKKLFNDYDNEKELTPSSSSMLRGPVRYSASSLRTRTSDYDSGLGTTNTTKLSRDSKLNTSTMDESHYQSLDDDRRRYSEEEQESVSNLSTSRSSGSGAASPGSPYSKYKKRFDRSSSSSKQLNEIRRRKPSGHSDVYGSDVDTGVTGPFGTRSKSASPPKTRSYYNWRPERTITQPLRSTVHNRSLSTDSVDLNNYKTRLHRPQTAPQTPSNLEVNALMNQKYRSGFIHQRIRPSKDFEPTYKSSFYVDLPHTHRKSQERFVPTAQPSYKETSPIKNLYLDPETGVLYRYIQTKSHSPSLTSYQPLYHTKSTQELYKCSECGGITTYHHRHHINTIPKRITTDIDDLGYESENRKLIRRRQYINRLISSDSDSDNNDDVYSDTKALNEAYERARKVQERSHNLSKHISRQLKLVLSTI